MKLLKMSITLLAFFGFIVTANAGTLDKVKANGFIKVGVNGTVFGFSMPDENGNWKGLDVDIARAISVAVFGKPDRIKFIPVTAVQQLPALNAKEIDVLISTTQTLTRETKNRLNFVHTTYYDGQGFLIHKKLFKVRGIKSSRQLGGVTVCVLKGTTSEMNASDYFRLNGINWKPLVIKDGAELKKAFFEGHCDCLTSNASHLAAYRAVAPNPKNYLLLGEIISQEPLGPAVRHGDDQWYDIVNFSVMALIKAERLGINSKNVKKMRMSKNPGIQRFLGVTPGMGAALGLNDNWAYTIIKQVGNYSEIFERNIGRKTPHGLNRGLNNLWTKGGLMYATPFR